MSLAQILTVALSGAVSLVAAQRCPTADVSAVRHTGTPVGVEQVHGGVNMYISKPEGWGSSCGEAKATKAVLYLTDVFGIQLNENKLLADSFARAGYLTVAPDMFNGTPAPADINTPGGPNFNTTEFLAKHGPDATDPIIATAVKYLREEVGVKSIAATGYCFGGRYSFRVLAAGKGVDVGFAAHPSLLQDDEVKAITGPASVAAAETDSLLSPARRGELEALLGATKQPFSFALYGGTSHGFAVRGNVSDPKVKFGKEEAFFQAVRFFDTWA